MIKHENLNSVRSRIKEKNDAISDKRLEWIKANPYFYGVLIKHLKFIIAEGSKVLHVRSGIGYILNELNPSVGIGIEESPRMIEESARKYPHLKFLEMNIEDISIEEKFDYVLISQLEDCVDIKAMMDSVKKCCSPNTRIILLYYNYLWNPVVRLAEFFKLKIPQKLHNWIMGKDISNIIGLCNYEVVTNKKIILYPYFIPFLSFLLNRFIAKLPLFRLLTFVNITVARPLFNPVGSSSVSIIIPCKNEAGNIEDAVRRIPQIGSHTEIIFCDDKSTDGTAEKVREMIEKHPEKDIKLVDGPGICKAENVWVGFDNAKGDILCILDADLTVMPEELPYFYEAITTGRGEFINGSRLIYPMQDEAMRAFNVVGNKFFSMLFTYILDTDIKDTLCGTKVLWKTDFERIKKLRGTWGITDRWGDYELIFGAAKCQLKIVDMPVHYMERIYGETKMTKRLKNGWIMLRMSMIALMKIKFYF
jgi:hypothetical protein